MNQNRRPWIVTGVVLSIAILGSIGSLPDAVFDEKLPGVQPGDAAPDFALQTPQGETFILSSFRGIPVLLNFWATWCIPCKYEMPTIQSVYEEFRGEIQVLTVNLTKQDDLVTVLAFVGEYELTFPVLLDRDGTVADAYTLRGLPSSFFVDSEGIIQSVVIGGPMTEEFLRRSVEQLLGRP